MRRVQRSKPIPQAQGPTARALGQHQVGAEQSGGIGAEVALVEQVVDEALHFEFADGYAAADIDHSVAGQAHYAAA